jgi:hypothetical protein
VRFRQKPYLATARVAFHAVTEDFSHPPRAVVKLDKRSSLPDATDPVALLLPLATARHCSNAQDVPQFLAPFMNILASVARELLEQDVPAADFKLTESRTAHGRTRPIATVGSEEDLAEQMIIRGLPWVWKSAPGRRDRVVELRIVGGEAERRWATIDAPVLGPVMFGALAILALVEYLARNLPFDDVVAPALTATLHVTDRLGAARTWTPDLLDDVEVEALEIVRSADSPDRIREQIVRVGELSTSIDDSVEQPARPEWGGHPPQQRGETPASAAPNGGSYGEEVLLLQLLRWHQRIRAGEDLRGVALDVLTASTRTREPWGEADKALGLCSYFVLGLERAKALENDQDVLLVLTSVAEIGFRVRIFEDSWRDWDLVPIREAVEAAEARLGAGRTSGDEPPAFWDAAPLACATLAFADRAERALPEPSRTPRGLGAELCALVASEAVEVFFRQAERRPDQLGVPRAQLERAFDYGYFVRCCESIADPEGREPEDEGASHNSISAEFAEGHGPDDSSQLPPPSLENAIAVRVYRLGSYEARLLIDAEPLHPSFRYFLAVLEPDKAEPVVIATAEKEEGAAEGVFRIFAGGDTIDTPWVGELEDADAFASRALLFAGFLLDIGEDPTEHASGSASSGQLQNGSGSTSIPAPQASSGRLAARYRLGPYEAHLYTDLETALGEIAYRHVLATFDGKGEPRLYVAAEQGPLGSRVLGVFDEHGHGSSEWNPLWEHLEPFAEHALKLSAEILHVSENPEPLSD